jgi:hypothetical protein
MTTSTPPTACKVGRPSSSAHPSVVTPQGTRQFKGKSEQGSTIDERARRLNDALARSFTAWLDGQGKLWPFYTTWRSSVTNDPTGRAAFEKVMDARRRQ